MITLRVEVLSVTRVLVRKVVDRAPTPGESTAHLHPLRAVPQEGRSCWVFGQNLRYDLRVLRLCHEPMFFSARRPNQNCGLGLEM
jgi:hypothetical protein